MTTESSSGQKRVSFFHFSVCAAFVLCFVFVVVCAVILRAFNASVLLFVLACAGNHPRQKPISCCGSSFFRRWFETLSTEQQERVRDIVREGRLEFVGGMRCCVSVCLRVCVSVCALHRFSNLYLLCVVFWCC